MELKYRIVSPYKSKYYITYYVHSTLFGTFKFAINAIALTSNLL